jgi:hypothetical protein
MMVLQSLQKRKSPVTVDKQSPGYVRRLILLRRQRRPAEELSAAERHSQVEILGRHEPPFNYKVCDFFLSVIFVCGAPKINY